MIRSHAVIVALAGFSLLTVGCRDAAPRWMSQRPAYGPHLPDGQTDPSQNPFQNEQYGPSAAVGGMPSSGRVHLGDTFDPGQTGAPSSGAVTVVQTGYDASQTQPHQPANPFPQSPGAGNNTSHDWHPSQSRTIGNTGPAVFPH